MRQKWIFGRVFYGLCAARENKVLSKVKGKVLKKRINLDKEDGWEGHEDIYDGDPEGYVCCEIWEGV